MKYFVIWVVCEEYGVAQEFSDVAPSDEYFFHEALPELLEECYIDNFVRNLDELEEDEYIPNFKEFAASAVAVWAPLTRSQYEAIQDEFDAF